MSHRRIPKRKAVLAGAGAVGIAAAAVLLPHANASQSGRSDEAAPRTMSASGAQDLLSRLGPSLGDAYGGAYYDAGRRQLVVNIAGGDDRAAERVLGAGAVARAVDNSMGELAGAAGTLAERAAIPGTAWAVDPRTNRLVVTADRTVTGERWDRLEAAVGALDAGTAEVERSRGAFTLFLEGGDAVFGGGARCSLGFNVTTGDGAPGFLTAGHCGVAAAQWSEEPNGAPVGTVRAATFPGDGDFALVTYDDPAAEAPSTVDLGNGQTLDIVGAGEAAVGLEVFRMGSTTGLRDGRVTGLDATVNYPEGTVTGLVQTDVCAEPGDSGGALFTRDGTAIGLTSGGSGDCTSGGETFFHPVTTALAAVGARIGAGQGDGGGAADGAGRGAGASGQGQGDGTGPEDGGRQGGDAPDDGGQAADHG
ncbi:S1 family peptidase [Streptomyces genisteinicus]|uniref:S1 family peptidase n=1 Tax=Streptomyces genisteinicus TaxID=2768068 RepID=A0A7H0HZS8_9ACTN|nr:S1 family peptidase [Streptomyces genisteinicus]QNP66044.1 S1 family peptidase [Streptomyces genisteinicus]